MSTMNAVPANPKIRKNSVKPILDPIVFGPSESRVPDFLNLPTFIFMLAEYMRQLALYKVKIDPNEMDAQHQG